MTSTNISRLKLSLLICLISLELGVFIGLCECAVLHSTYHINDFSSQRNPKKTFMSSNFHCDDQNCSDVDGEKLPKNLTDDGYLKVLKDGIATYLPPEQFCVSRDMRYAKQCTSHVSPTPWRKCCPEDQLLNPNAKLPGSCKSHILETLQFRPKINGRSESFFVLPGKFTCPNGFHLKKFSMNKCAEKSLTRFQLSPNGTISYEVAIGVFLRKSGWETMKPSSELYCIDGVINSCLQSSASFRSSPSPASIIIIRSHNKNSGGKETEEMMMTRESSSPVCSSSSSNDKPTPTPVLYLCQENTKARDIQKESIASKTTFLAVIWLMTCPLLFGASLVNSLIIQRNVHGWILTSYLLSMCVLNVLSVIVILKVGRKSLSPPPPPTGDIDDGDDYFMEKLACSPIDFAIKFMYMSTLCWMTSINFGLWKTFSFTLPQPAGLRRFIASVLFSLGFPATSVILCYYVAYWGTDLQCKQEHCLLYSHDTVFLYTLPMCLMVLGNFAIFLRTSYKIIVLRREAEDVLQRQAHDHLESFTLFAKLFLLTGGIWLLKLVLLVLQLQGSYFTWYGMILEMMFSSPEVVFPMIVFHHQEFIKWSFKNCPKISSFITKLDPFFNIQEKK